MRHVDEFLAVLYTPWLVLTRGDCYEDHEC